MIGEFILKHRVSIGILLLAITAYFGYGVSKLTIATSFVDFFPRNHPYVRLYHDYGRYGGAQTLTLMVQVKQGDVYTSATARLEFTLYRATFTVNMRARTSRRA